ncbi:LemA family protein [Clostridium sp. OF09-36]|uniref:LemA family protein n=1 Tax=Clostridium sp. OF09-36 TaxID=2292310 RepID=UPI000E46EAA4|nr:LemA family protein [Clostridium sp. OF09-36]RHV86238.1 LemA family protein [Clostridium sp. OF09-36]
MGKMKVAAVGVVGAICLVLMCVFGVQSSRNKAIVLEQAVETAESNIHVQEKRRFDLLPNLVDAIKQYDKHEAEVLQAIVDGRGGAAGIENVSTAISAVAEAYPELKSNENYKQYMTELATTENLISQYRENYNTQVGNYRRYVKGFPARIFLDWTGYEMMTYDLLDYGAPTDAPKNLFGD